MEFFEQGAVDAGFEIKAVQIGFGGHFDEVAKAGAVLGQQREVITVFFERSAVALEPAFGGDIGFVAEDGIDASVFGGLIELECSVQIAMIGDGQGVHAQRFARPINFSIGLAPSSRL